MKGEETILKWIVKEIISTQNHRLPLNSERKVSKLKKYKKWFSQPNKKGNCKKGKSQWEGKVRLISLRIEEMENKAIISVTEMITCKPPIGLIWDKINKMISLFQQLKSNSKTSIALYQFKNIQIKYNRMIIKKSKVPIHFIIKNHLIG